ncbi:MAG: DUF2249 domain-containing protein [Ignavibacterium album]|nr:DUF2249 domain-containing protein [Ignavibacterium album]
MITGDMKISEILNKYPQTLEVLVKTSPHFRKLENKLLRKALASRVNVIQAANIAGVDPNELLNELNKSIGKDFNMSDLISKDEISETLFNEIPDALQKISEDKIIKLDVRPILDQGRDPFNDIMSKVKELKEEEVLLLINSFEPVPLYSVLGNKGFEHWTEKEGNVYKVYFFREQNILRSASRKSVYQVADKINFENVIELDVRELPPPEPMIKILEALPKIDENSVLLVHHHREPVMLYPKLEERGFQAVTNKIDDNYFKVLIFRKESEK